MTAGDAICGHIASKAGFTLDIASLDQRIASPVASLDDLRLRLFCIVPQLSTTRSEHLVVRFEPSADRALSMEKSAAP